MAQPSEQSPRRLRRKRLRRVLLGLIALLFVFSVPWYRSADAPLHLWFGLPDWVAVALLCYLGAGLLNAWAWWITDVTDPSPGDSAEAGPSTRAGQDRA